MTRYLRDFKRQIIRRKNRIKELTLQLPKYSHAHFVFRLTSDIGKTYRYDQKKAWSQKALHR